MNYHMTKSINIECETGRLLYVTHDIIRITHVLTCTLGCKIFRIFSERIYNNDLNNKRIKKNEQLHYCLWKISRPSLLM